MMDLKTPEFRAPELSELADQIGEFIQYWGFKKVHGRIWAHLFLSDVPLDAMALRTRLKISKALVSLTVKDLIEFGVIRECGKSERGTILYEAHPEVHTAIFNVIRGREKKMLSQISAAHRSLSHSVNGGQHSLGVNGDRLKNLGEMIEGASNGLDCLLATSGVGSGSLETLFGTSRASRAVSH